ncbi:MAG: AI-2E family transporter [Candidatus Dormibacteraeota bacterium]|nr:AI-2E family transporter [Candidatus Dormibacteraeota bacterium]
MGAPDRPSVTTTPDTSPWSRRLTVSLTILTWLAILVLVVWLLSHVVLAILLFVLAAVVGYALAPVVTLLNRWMPRPLAIALSYVFGVAAAIGLVFVVGYTATTELAALVHVLPGYLDRAHELESEVLAILHPFGVGRAQLDEMRAALLRQVHDVAGAVAAGSLEVVQGTLSAVLSAILTLILSIYLAANGPRMRLLLMQAGERLGHGERVGALIETTGQVVGGYVRGTLAMALMIGLLVGGSMAVIRVPYEVLLGAIGFFMQFIPIVGVMVSGAICILVALAALGWQKALVVWGVFIAIHVFEGDVVGPRVLGKAVGIHPATALIAFVAGTELWGIWGALFGAPIAGLLQALAVAGYRSLAVRGAPDE